MEAAGQRRVGLGVVGPDLLADEDGRGRAAEDDPLLGPLEGGAPAQERPERTVGAVAPGVPVEGPGVAEVEQVRTAEREAEQAGEQEGGGPIAGRVDDGRANRPPDPQPGREGVGQPEELADRARSARRRRRGRAGRAGSSRPRRRAGSRRPPRAAGGFGCGRSGSPVEVAEQGGVALGVDAVADGQDGRAPAVTGEVLRELGRALTPAPPVGNGWRGHRRSRRTEGGAPDGRGEGGRTALSGPRSDRPSRRQLAASSRAAASTSASVDQPPERQPHGAEGAGAGQAHREQHWRGVGVALVAGRAGRGGERRGGGQQLARRRRRGTRR